MQETCPHPLEYADFERVIAEGYGAGIVMLWDRGTWRPEADNVDAAERSWLLIKHRDEWSGGIDVTQAAPLCVKSFGDFAGILAQEKPDVWQSYLPSRGGVAGAMLRQVIEQAARLKSSPPRPTRSRKGKRSSSLSPPHARRREAQA